jgi:hypothetical protein
VTHQDSLGDWRSPVQIRAPRSTESPAHTGLLLVASNQRPVYPVRNQSLNASSRTRLRPLNDLVSGLMDSSSESMSAQTSEIAFSMAKIADSSSGTATSCSVR